MRYTATVFVLLWLTACSGPVDTDEGLKPNPFFAAAEGAYASQKNPVMVGNLPGKTIDEKERDYLARLRGPDGQRVKYWRVGICCRFSSPNLPDPNTRSHGFLNKYFIRYKGIEKEFPIYLNPYDPGEIDAPPGFTIFEEKSAEGEDSAAEKPVTEQKKDPVSPTE